MAEKRKDSKGRNLLTGESERKDGTYMYRYTTSAKQRKTVYAKTLNELRIKEKQIKKDIDDGIDAYAKLTVEELLTKYVNENRNWKEGTRISNKRLLEKIKSYPINNMKVQGVKQSHVREFYTSLYDNGLKRSTIKGYQSIFRPAFQQAVDDDIIRKNPFDIGLSFLPKETKDRTYLTKEQEEDFMKWVENSYYREYYYIWDFLLSTGLRIGELLGLRLSDIDLDKREIRIHHQLVLQNRNGDKRDMQYYYTTLKTKSSKRNIYLSDRAKTALEGIIRRREQFGKVTIVGIDDFLMIGRDVRCMTSAQNIATNLTKAVNEYNKTHKTKIPTITPHSFRRTFCTRCVENGLDLKSLQYIMGHAHVIMSLDVYTRWSSDNAREALKNLDL